MKALFKSFALLVILAFFFAPSLIRAQDDSTGDQGVSFQAFYDQLGDQGSWIQTDDYGYVFQPNVSDPNWAPYTDGHWAYTDVGWMWVSDEPWGWATYHYGRWANIDGFGWVWVPGYRWAPAWVSWRYGGGYCGWAPLPPGSFLGAEYGGSGGWATFHFGGDVDVSFGIGAGCYNFVRVGDMGDPNYHGHFIDRSNNYVVINKTTNVTNINITRNGGATSAFGGVAVGGPPINQVNAHSQQHIATVQLAAANQPGQSGVQGNSLAVYAPKMNPTSVHTAKPARVSQTIANPTFNRGDSISKPLDVTASVKAPAPTAAAIQAATTAQAHAPAKAKIATVNTPVKTTLTKPLTSLAPVAPVHRTTSTTAPSANTANSNVEHSTAESSFTGESVKPSAPQPNAVKPTTTYQPQAQSSGAQTYHPSSTPPATTYHPETEAKPQDTYKPQTQSSSGQAYHPSSTPPATTYHPASQPSHEAAPPTHTQSAPASHSAPSGGQGNKPAGGNGNKKAADDKNNPQGH